MTRPAKRRLYSAQVIPCPKCGHGHTKVVCGHLHGDNQKLRRRKCLNCGYRVKTLQNLYPEIGKEFVVPLLTAEEKRDLRRANKRLTTLTVQDVLEIKYFLSKNSFTQGDLALQYGVTKGTIATIKRGQSWKDVPTPTEYP
tara:strand:- start:553 stop:975 length:423 start_codon:yes stop_codon:yes gene_type:complete